MRTMIAIAAAVGFLTLGEMDASAAQSAPMQTPDGAGASIQQADWGWYCGPRCHYWRHRRWEQYHRWGGPYYGYNYYRPYGYGYYYR